jgi:RecB family endonuclease NucS
LRLATGLKTIPGGGPPTNKHFEALGFTVDYLDEGSQAEQTAHELDGEVDVSISLEADIENALVSNLEQLEPGLRIWRHGVQTGQQFRFNFDANKQGRIDILAVDADDNFVVIEIKVGEADRDVCGQIQGYMGWVSQHMADHKNVRGIIVASDFSVRAVYAAKVVADLRLKKYQISFRFIDGV